MQPDDVEVFFKKAIGSDDVNDLVLFKSKLGFDYNIFKNKPGKISYHQLLGNTHFINGKTCSLVQPNTQSSSLGTGGLWGCRH